MDVQKGRGLGPEWRLLQPWAQVPRAVPGFEGFTAFWGDGQKSLWLSRDFSVLLTGRHLVPVHLRALRTEMEGKPLENSSPASLLSPRSTAPAEGLFLSICCQL